MAKKGWTVRAISLWQPWADLVARGLKGYETRSWNISYRGIIAIHAAKKKLNSRDYGEVLRRQMLQDEVDPYFLRFGCFVCFAEVIDSEHTEAVRGNLSLRELAYGNFDDERFAWKFGRIFPLRETIDFPGHQGIFNWKLGDEVYKGLKNEQGE